MSSTLSKALWKKQAHCSCSLTLPRFYMSDLIMARNDRHPVRTVRWARPNPKPEPDPPTPNPPEPPF
ncbi:hypothetical protein VTI28DRAFT_2409 [Corynascus sepedonium]